MIRPFEAKDAERIREIHAANNLPAECFPDLADPLILHTGIVDVDGRAVIACALKGTSELYLFVDHNAGTPEERWQWLLELREHMVHQAWLLGLDQMSCWIPPEIEESFAKRLEEMGFRKSPWSCYTLQLEK